VESTNYFTISAADIEQPRDGVYCAYCGKKGSLIRDADTSGFVFQCGCAGAQKEQELFEQRKNIEKEIKDFLDSTAASLQITKLRTRITIYEEYVHELKKELQQLLSINVDGM